MYVARYRAGTNLVLLDPDVAKAFPDEAAVNEALRLVIRLTEIQRSKKRSQTLIAGSYLGRVVEASPGLINNDMAGYRSLHRRRLSRANNVDLPAK